jgi:ribonuclease D
MDLLQSTEELRRICAEATEHGILAIDMEFERERTFRPVLQLVQVATAAGSMELIDPLALRDLSPLWEVIEDPDVEVVLHAGHQDMEIAYIESGGRLPHNVFDTQIAAALLGMGEQPGYADLVRRVTGTRLKKGERTTNWGARPLTDAQKRYALDDVLHLQALHDTLQRELEKRGRMAWARDEMLFYEDAGTYDRDREQLWKRVSRHRSLDRRGLGILRELAAWREDAAERRDIPRSRVLNDELLVELSRRRPQATAGLRQLRRLHPREIERSGKELLAAIERGLQCDDDQLPRLPRTPDDDADLRVTADLLATFVKVRAHEVEIAPSYLASKSQIKSFARAHRRQKSFDDSVELAHGWRYELVGRDLERFLDGELGLAVDVRGGGLRLLPLASDVTDGDTSGRT